MADLIERARAEVDLRRMMFGEDRTKWSRADRMTEELLYALEAAREDAERYRWLRRREGNNRWPHIAQYPRQAHDRVEVPQLFDTRFGDKFAERLDAAIEQARGKGGAE